jgi:hypothetical protein
MLGGEVWGVGCVLGALRTRDDEAVMNGAPGGGDEVILLREQPLATNDCRLKYWIAFKQIDVMVGVLEEPHHLPVLA